MLLCHAAAFDSCHATYAAITMPCYAAMLLKRLCHFYGCRAMPFDFRLPTCCHTYALFAAMLLDAYCSDADADAPCFR